PTPSAAAELVIPDYEQWKGQLQAYQERLTNYMVRRISEARQAVAALGDRPVLARPLEGIDGYRQVLDEFLGRLTMAWEVRQQNRRHGVGLLTGKLDALSPLKVLARGYSITRRPGGAILRSVEEIEAGEQLEVLLVDGSLATEVLKVEKGE
ncbi:MAG: exodeoxyribonuclease VII large subunit, partial [Limnochordia bacterium]